ncbi:MAG: aspartate--tRNA ligase [Ignavibacteriota bacterium]|nr:MAG: aspartate--tRNA ligase [Chlorobiota bacterium]MBE7475685.1 aspartate--tRNA ligase [Ignavibacteriales bacterium]MBL1123006.1 aspartate--tRNA ligase [Ignavibacteriota bacterium]MCC7093015.1 aspartate--tRNA ligase [Ignavibacteriaceae bacterium]MCE7856061.1 aspartate--tRNA ligase [Ignavibacteria bacterium CHB3]MEB2295120.1 aspartate--tRNA ligase [Ignavibacteria bacterium]
MSFKIRTHTCGELRENNIGEKVVLNGWVDRRRDLGALIFIWLRDRYGITQVVFSQSDTSAKPDINKDVYDLAKKLRNEFVISVEGTVRRRPDDAVNKELETGTIDVLADNLIILNEADTPPFAIKDDTDAFEDLRLKYRYLDLRRPALQKVLLLRHKMAQLVRRYFDENNFVEIETPVLMKSTPEGARDYLVPSRIHKGKFYALPQSPQQYKQLLMVSGFDRYFQIVKCFRDEDLRADRQPEFTQIDVEMSFVSQEQVFSMVEGLMKLLFKEIWNVDLSLPLKRLSYEDAMLKYGSDKPDLRFEMELHTLNEVFQKSEFKVFRDVIDSDGIVCGIVAQNSAAFSRSQIDGLTNFVKNLGAKGLVWFKVQFNGIDSPTAKFLSEEEKRNLLTAMKAEPNDLILILAGEKKSTLNQMGALRLELAKRLELIKSETLPSLLWITDFPLFDWDEETKRFYAMHHPFTSPKIEEIDLLEKDPGKIKAQAYDLVLNGNEIAGGSIRIHNSELQSRMFRALGISDEEAKQKFGFLMNAFKYGAPPHGGIAFGFDRMVMLFAGVDSIRDTIAFPKTASAVSLMDECPSEVSEEQLRELHIKIVDK